MPQNLSTASKPPATLRRPARRKVGNIFFRKLPLETETTIFILVNMLDFFVTYWLLHSRQFVESNPIARWFHEGWGPIKGMLMFKLALVALVCLIAQIAYPYRPKVARALLVFGSLVVSAVVIYSLNLHRHHGGNGPNTSIESIMDFGDDEI